MFSHSIITPPQKNSLLSDYLNFKIQNIEDGLKKLDELKEQTIKLKSKIETSYEDLKSKYDW